MSRDEVVRTPSSDRLRRYSGAAGTERTGSSAPPIAPEMTIRAPIASAGKYRAKTSGAETLSTAVATP